MGTVVYETGNPGRLAVPGFAAILMAVVFGMPAVMLPATTWRLVPEFPVILPLAYVAAFFPLAVLFTLRRLMSRYALRLVDGGGVELVLPFRTHRIAPEQLSSVRLVSSAGPAARGRQAFVHFVGPDGQSIASVALHAFSAVQWQQFLVALAQAAPRVAVDGFPSSD